MNRRVRAVCRGNDAGETTVGSDYHSRRACVDYARVARFDVACIAAAEWREGTRYAESRPAEREEYPGFDGWWATVNRSDYKCGSLRIGNHESIGASLNAIEREHCNESD